MGVSKATLLVLPISGLILFVIVWTLWNSRVEEPPQRPKTVPSNRVESAPPPSRSPAPEIRQPGRANEDGRPSQVGARMAYPRHQGPADVHFREARQSRRVPMVWSIRADRHHAF